MGKRTKGIGTKKIVKCFTWGNSVVAGILAWRGNLHEWWFQWFFIPSLCLLLCWLLREFLKEKPIFDPRTYNILPIWIFPWLLLFEWFAYLSSAQLFPPPETRPFVFLLNLEESPDDRILLTNDFLLVPHPDGRLVRNRGIVVMPLHPQQTNATLAVTVRSLDFAEHVELTLFASKDLAFNPVGGWSRMRNETRYEFGELEKWRIQFRDSLHASNGSIALVSIPQSGLKYSTSTNGAVMMIAAQAKDHPANGVTFQILFPEVPDTLYHTPLAIPTKGGSGVVSLEFLPIQK